MLTSDPRLVARRIGERARKQNGVISREQLLEEGLNPGAITRWLETGRLFRVHRGAYLLVPPAEASRLTLIAAAALACGEGAVVSHGSAAELWGLGLVSERPELTTPYGSPRERPGIVCHRAVRLDTRDIRRRRGLNVTSPARTVCDLTRRLKPAEIEQLISVARVKRLCTIEELTRTAARSAFRPSAVLALLDGQRRPRLTRSVAEQRLLELVRAAGLPGPEVNVKLGGLEVDLLWREAGVVVEVDGFAFHGDRLAFERDRERDARLAAVGLRVLRVTWRQIEDEPLVVVARIAGALAAGG